MKSARSAVSTSPARNRILVAHSPGAGRRSRRETVQQIARMLESHGYETRTTADGQELSALADQWNTAGALRVVLACGGDGTAAYVRNRVPLEVPLLVVPLGTENLLGRYLGQAAAPPAVVATVDRGVVIELDLGRIVSRRPDADSYFLMMVSAGFDAEIVRRMHQRRRGHITRASYLQPTIHTIRSYTYPELQLYCCDGESAGVPRACRWALAFNLPLYACGWQFAPTASGSDALLDVCGFRHGSTWHTARYLWHATWKRPASQADAVQMHARKLRIEAADDADVAYQVDGDFGGSLPVELELLPAQQRLLVMPEVATRLGFSMPAIAPD